MSTSDSTGSGTGGGTGGGSGAGGGRALPAEGRVDWDGRRVLVTGMGVSGAAAAYALAERGASVVAVDDRDPAGAPVLADRAGLLDVLGGRALLGPGSGDGPLEVDGELPDVLVTSPGWRPDAGLLAKAAAAGVPVWGEVELAWRLRHDRLAAAPDAPPPAPWLTVTGTNGKTTTTTMLASILTAAGLRTTAAGNIGTPLVEAVLDPLGHDVIAVELSSFQLHHAHTIAPRASTCLNIAPDHLDWHGSMAGYAADKARVYERTELACLYDADDPAGATEEMVREADVQEGCRAIGLTRGVPGLSMLGVVDGVMADRAFVAERRTAAAELATIADLERAWGAGEGAGIAPHTVANALAAAALARAHGVPARAVREGLRATSPGEHRITVVARDGAVTWIDDSKATNAHAADASLTGVAGGRERGQRTVWIAGGLAKGASFDDLVAHHAGELRGVVLIGEDRAPWREVLARLAPDVPVREAVDGGGGAPAATPATPSTPSTGLVAGTSAGSDGDVRGRGVMDAAVAAAATLARPGDTVLLAPACASMDQFDSYAARGDAFAAAVRAHLRRG